MIISKQAELIVQLYSSMGRGAFPGFAVYHVSECGLE